MASGPTPLGGDFDILGPLGAGGMAGVYRAEQLSTGQQCVVKTAQRRDATGLEAVRRFFREPRLLLRIPSDHIARVIRIGDADDETLWFAMELLDGESLDARLRREKYLEPGEAVAVLFQVCKTLDVAHRRGIVHRNINPGNIYLSTSSRGEIDTKVLGFGIAEWAQEPDSDKYAVGTPLYMAPEQIQPTGIVSPTTDVWAVGLLAFEMLTGRPYWDAQALVRGSFFELWDKILFGEIDRASTRAEELGGAGRIISGFDDWFARCVSRDMSERFATVGEALQALSDLVAAEHVKPVWSVVLPDGSSGSVDSVADQLQAITGDSSLVLKRVVRGSIVLLIEGSRRAYEVVRTLFEEQVLSRTVGVAVDDVQWRCGSSRTSSELFGALGHPGEESFSERGARNDSGLQVFISYAQRDGGLCDELLIHLSMMRREGFIREWYDRLVAPGVDRKMEAQRMLESSEVVLPLLSADFIASDECFQLEMGRAFEKHERGEARIIPVVVRACDWEHPPLGLLPALPTDAKPVTSWANRDEAWLDVIRGIRRALEGMRRR
ncbi:protein kinase domain-containing protein [Sorangium sp. So ce1389]|uniref:protein kinase domain-containing protein n=1 Tax=Sorangium sp. So ce1389 TaxID=3133336 RepID=UPI003F5DC139